MLLDIARFEIRYQLRNPVFWVSVGIFFLFGFGLKLGGAVNIGSFPAAVLKNAPIANATYTAAFAMLYLMVVTAFVANAITRDDTTKFGPIIRSTQVTRIDFVLGRFIGALVIALVGFLAYPIGSTLSNFMPWVDPATIGAFRFDAVLWSYFVIAVPTIFLESALLFGVATLTRSTIGAYIAAIALIFIYIVANTIIGQGTSYGNNPQFVSLVSILDPFGGQALAGMSRYWTLQQMSANMPLLAGDMAINRILLIGISSAMLALVVWRFSMSEPALSKRALRKLGNAKDIHAQQAQSEKIIFGKPVQKNYGFGASQALFASRVSTEIKQTLKSTSFLILFVMAILRAVGNIAFSETKAGTPSYPITADNITTLRESFCLFLLIVAVFFGAELIWKEREKKFNEILDATPSADWVFVLPKILTLLATLLIMNIGGLITAVGMQLAKGSVGFNISQYIQWYLIPATIDAFLIAVLAVFAQILSPNKYVGWGIMMCWFALTFALDSFGYSNELYTYARTIAQPLSDMDSNNNFWIGAAWTRVYWVFAAILLIILSQLLWPRGTDIAFTTRLKRLSGRVTRNILMIGVAAIAGLIGSGIYIYHNIKQLNQYRTEAEAEQWAADFEKHYIHLSHVDMPTVSDIKLNVAIYPKERRLDAAGAYHLINKSNAPIHDVFFTYYNPELNILNLTVTGARHVVHDRRLGFEQFHFDTPLLPGKTAVMEFKSQIWSRGFSHGAPSTKILFNGTFLKNTDFMPAIGVNRFYLLKDRLKRLSFGLPEEIAIPKLEDMAATRKNYLNADMVNSDISVSTDSDQIPMAPGEPVSDTSDNGRRLIRYVSSQPFRNVISIQSGRFKVAKILDNGVTLGVYYQPGHEWNVSRMLKATKDSLDYYTKNFGPYQFKSFNIVELPGYEETGIAFPGTIPISENMGFAADLRDPESLDYVTYLLAHEFAHQYWGYQLTGADMQGATLLSETLAQYSAMMILEKTYCTDKSRRFLKYQLDRYLSGRQGATSDEVPLIRLDPLGQEYIRYEKGAVVMYLLRVRLGEQAINTALKRFLNNYRNAKTYPRSLDLIAEFRKEAKTPEDQALITDLFEKITMYNISVKSARSVRTSDGQWSTTIAVDAHRYYVDGKGNQQEIPFQESIETGAFTQAPGISAFSKNSVISMSRISIKNGLNSIVLKTPRKPQFVGVDPYNYYIDQNSDDNILEIKAD